MARARYRLRTQLRSTLPQPLSRRFPNGQHNCGDHERYRSDGTTWRCYHCEVGVTHENPWDEREQTTRSLEADAMRVRAGLDAPQRTPLVRS